LVERSINKVIGVVTNNGTILCDKVVVAAGYTSKNIIDLLGIRLPLLPVQGYSFTIDNTKKILLNHLISEDAGLAHIAPLKNKLRISGIADIGSINDFDQERLNLLLKSAEKYTGPIDSSTGKSWIGVRPLTPDDVPVIGPIPGYPDIILNTGHSSKGLTLSLGSAIAVRNMLEGKDKEKLEKDYSLNRFYLI
jgi:D-amino-acid dehydrogenase